MTLCRGSICRSARAVFHPKVTVAMGSCLLLGVVSPACSWHSHGSFWTVGWQCFPIPEISSRLLPVGMLGNGTPSQAPVSGWGEDTHIFILGLRKTMSESLLMQKLRSGPGSSFPLSGPPDGLMAVPQTSSREAQAWESRWAAAAL